MKNSKILPFERNKYYYGKLLSVEDFNLEQKYFNDKRRLINRLINGTGVVAGMNVIGLDEQTISVESGVALDSTGREIVIDVPETKKLSLIDGYDSCINGGAGRYLYLCIEYDEQDKGAVHNIAESSGVANNRIKESYRLFLTKTEPSEGIMKPEDMYEETTPIYYDDTVKINHVVTKYVRPGGKCNLRVEIENTGKQYVSFSYDVHLTCLTYKKEASFKVSFDEVLNEKSGKYTLNYQIDALDVNNTDGIVAIDPASFILSFDNRRVNCNASGRTVTKIADKDIKTEVYDEYHNTSLDNIMRTNQISYLYLAKIYLVNAGNSVVIENIEQVPFGQYVSNQMLHSAIDRLLESGSGDALGLGAAGGKAVSGKNNKPAVEIASGVCRINIGVGGQKNQNFFSDEIIHGLGLGSVTLILGLAENNNVTYGASYIFAEQAPRLQLAAKLDPSKGTFIIGLRLMLATTEEFVDVKWTAIRDVPEKISEKNAMKIFIKPATLMLSTRESYYLEAVCSNMANKAIIWSVGANSGTIDANGMYTAPNLPGVYEVIAKSAVYPEVSASIMVVVRE